ncbi:SGNH/GDSL hydrolase family protein [Micromonospora craterilacus]|uniref:SGNH/GDSL hydrolase family protein n=1 Tax=Micromonospora craterilacus TaxID=1655439 RepID=UPI001F3878A7|nr:SGNH/GDSL hydrolase family protein [Micromonospora craterilacus]
MNSSWITTPITADLLRGALDLQRTARGVLPHRLPARARAQNTDGQLTMVEAQPAGVRLALRTRATAVELDTLPTRQIYAGLPARPVGVYDLIIDGHLTGQASVTGGDTVTIDMTTGGAEHRSGPPGTIRFTGRPDRVKDLEIWLPHNETTELVALRTDAPVAPTPDQRRRVWLHHGSSISQGSNATSPTATWPARAASLGGVDLVNLGLGGSALLDPFTARTMRDTPADLISVKIGINLVNTDVMRLRAFVPAVHGFLDTIRDGHPSTPLLVVSPIYCPIHEAPRARARSTSSPSAPDRCGSGPRATRRNGRAGSSRSVSSAPSWRGSPPSGRPTTRTCTTSTASTSTASPTSPNCRCPISSTRTPPPTAASPNASPSRRSPHPVPSQSKGGR